MHQEIISASTAQPHSLAETHSAARCNLTTGIASGSSRLAESTPLLVKKRWIINSYISSHVLLYHQKSKNT